MKIFTTIKIGYTSGIYGCSNEYFTTIYTSKKGLESFTFYGMYGAEDRVARAFRDKGYTEKYTPSVFGKMTRNDIPKKFVVHEDDAIKYTVERL